jgi:hypothetical protein
MDSISARMWGSMGEQAARSRSFSIGHACRPSFDMFARRAAKRWHETAASWDTKHVAACLQLMIMCLTVPSLLSVNSRPSHRSPAFAAASVDLSEES